MPDFSKINLFGQLRIIPGRDKITFIPGTGLPEGIHITFHNGGASGFADVHLTRERDSRHAPLIRIPLHRLDGLLESLGMSILGKITKFVTADDLKEAYACAVVFPPEGSADMEAMQAVLQKFSPPRVVKRTLRLLEAGDEVMFRDPEMLDEITQFIEISDICDFYPQPGMSGFLVGFDGTFIGFIGVNDHSILLIESVDSIRERFEDIIGSELFGKLKDRFNAALLELAD